jgi:muramidase (phage lysozyme)
MTKSNSFHPANSKSSESKPGPWLKQFSNPQFRKTLADTPEPLGIAENRSRILQPRILYRVGWRKPAMVMGLLVALTTFHLQLPKSWQDGFRSNGQLYPPLALQGGDPYLRALMRTISASESNDTEPYSLLYGGDRFSDWSDHPDRCLTITVGPNTGDCTTAAGRYQFITTTWDEKAKAYHPHPEGWWMWQRYPFDPVSQDQVVYRWLDDAEAWSADIPSMLRQKRVPEVLALLSGTWTSLGYGIETNDMSSQLETLYQRFLAEEKSRS